MKIKAGRLLDKVRPGSTASSPAPPDADTDPPTVSDSGRHAYADSPTPPAAITTAGSVIYELLAAARDGSDMCLPLKAALVGIIKIWDVCEVYRSHIYAFDTKII